MFNKEWLQLLSPYPKDYIPKGGAIFIGVDMAKDGSDCTVKGFKDPETGEWHIQEITYRNN